MKRQETQTMTPANTALEALNRTAKTLAALDTPPVTDQESVIVNAALAAASANIAQETLARLTEDPAHRETARQHIACTSHIIRHLDDSDWSYLLNTPTLYPPCSAIDTTEGSVFYVCPRNGVHERLFPCLGCALVLPKTGTAPKPSYPEPLAPTPEPTQPNVHQATEAALCHLQHAVSVLNAASFPPSPTLSALANAIAATAYFTLSAAEHHNDQQDSALPQLDHKTQQLHLELYSLLGGTDQRPLMSPPQSARYCSRSTEPALLEFNCYPDLKHTPHYGEELPEPCQDCHFHTTGHRPTPTDLMPSLTAQP